MRSQSNKRGGAGLAFLVLLLGFAVGITLFMPWETLCERLVRHVDSKLESVNFTWKDIRRAGPSGFRIDNLAVGFANAPGALRFEHADLRFGISPLARVRLNTGGEECLLKIYRSGLVECEGQINLTYLLGGSGMQGTLFAKGGIMTSETESGWLHLRSHRLILADGTESEDLSLTVEIRGGTWELKNISLRKPLDFQGKGSVALDRGDLRNSLVTLAGEVAVGNTFHPLNLENRLGFLLGAPGR
ncbi:hypothetical protein [Salidesulfovibrio onnuriiensis]|uniref:hypothetical protein n=1 Tax=Salidesulfovibrio onnuriiensis TaxID=2583823 RepID=UPI0011CB1865|nr:hypothetical protein [Salidesulfovibrio onnuriiensis]